MNAETFLVIALLGLVVTLGAPGLGMVFTAIGFAGLVLGFVGTLLFPPR